MTRDKCMAAAVPSVARPGRARRPSLHDSRELFGGAEGHGDVGFVGFFYFKHWLRGQVHEAGYEGVGHLLDTDVEGVYGVVVELAAVGNLAFEVGDSSLQAHEIVVGFQLRIVLGYGKKAAEC